MAEERGPALFIASTILAAAVGMFVGVLVMRPGRRANPARPTWRQYIGSEWWLMPDGTLIEADSSSGKGHQMVAFDQIVDRDKFVGAVLEAGYSSESVAAFWPDASDALVWFLREKDRFPPEELVMRAIRKPPLWPEGKPFMKRVAVEHVLHSTSRYFMEYYGGIRVVGRSFQVDRLDDASIRRVQDFLFAMLETVSGKYDLWQNYVEIEDTEDNYISEAMAEFLERKHARDARTA